MSSNRFIPITVPTTNLLSEEIEFRSDGNGNALRNIDCYVDCALLIELANGFYGKDGTGYAFPALRQSIHDYRGKGEWTADHIDFDATAHGAVVPAGYARANWIQYADKILRKGKTYHAEGGVVTPVELPPNGWQVPDSERRMFHPVTGSPLQTIPRNRKQDAIKMLQDAGFDENDLSYFYRADTGLRAVFRDFFLYDSGPFYVYAGYGPDHGLPNLGGRACRRLEQATTDDALHRRATGLATPGGNRKIVIGISPEEYRHFLRLKEFYEKVGENLRNTQE